MSLKSLLGGVMDGELGHPDLLRRVVDGIAKLKRHAEMLKKYDTDGDGKLSDSEREALRKDMREKHQESENR